jgi:hypothetical protein
MGKPLRKLVIWKRKRCICKLRLILGIHIVRIWWEVGESRTVMSQGVFVLEMLKLWVLLR